MFSVSNLRIGQRLAIAFGVCVLLMGAMAIVATFALKGLGDRVHEINDDRLVKVLLADAVKDELNLQSRIVRNVLLLSEPTRIEAEWRQLDESRGKVGESYKKIEPMLASEHGKALFGKLQKKRTDYVDALTKYRAIVAVGDGAASRGALMDVLRPQHREYLDALEEFTMSQVELMKATGVQTEQVATRTSALLAAAALIGTIVATVSGWLVTRSIVAPMSRAVVLAESVAQGDLTVLIEADRNDETGALLKALKVMNESLVKMVSEVRQSSESIATGSGQIATGTADLSQRTEEQASNLQQTAASMEELTSTVRNNAETAQQANQLAIAASEAATRGGNIVNKVITTMDDISSSSAKINDIIGVIDGIAFQTNILALNAAVEAARAGEQGRGFAVVASEVRSLAQRSANAAKEIKTLIGDSVGKVKEGSLLVNDAGDSMQGIVRQVQRVSDLIAEISSATNEQSSGIGQVGHAVNELDKVTQQNAALVEESAAASESLKDQAARLSELVSAFKISGASALTS